MPVMPPPPRTRALRWSLMPAILTHGPTSTRVVTCATLWASGEGRTRMTATQDAPTPTAHSWPPGLPRSLDHPAVPVGSILRAAVRRWGDRTAFVDHDVPLTFTELGARAYAVAN